jgi:hypothetical protein
MAGKQGAARKRTKAAPQTGTAVPEPGKNATSPLKPAAVPKVSPKLPPRQDLGLGEMLRHHARQAAPQPRGTRKQTQQRRTAKGRRS